MNRRKAIVMLSGAESFLLGISFVLYISETISLQAFVGLLMAPLALSLALIFLIVRKLPPM